ncbi:hypothetical protein L1987_72980 [Smallanthus sonchifolius]|uniref:Uncharacterized protein n=1 Tax=Smallanthus sonchifolius TaxID=185202 RepID=A0ACB9AWQ3_9ASTR|nr:hypothetical protein L1987_72980 [Smallanthus sonchifolius]
MAVSIPILVVIISLHLLAFVLAIGAELRRSTAKAVPDESDEYWYCAYTSSASTEYGLLAFGLLLISQTVVNAVTKCLCFNKVVVRGYWRTLSIICFIISWVGFVGAEACLLGGSAKNAYHTKYRSIFGDDSISCETLHKGVFAVGAGFVSLSMVGSIVYYWAHSMVDTSGSGWDELHHETKP